MKRETFYKLAIAVLLVLNILQVIPFFLKSKHSGHAFHFREKAIQILNLEDDQKAVFLKLTKTHNTKMKALFEEEKEVTNTYFKNPSDSLLNSIALIETEKIKVTNQHFSDIKHILKESQLEHFEDFKKRALQIILKTNNNHKPLRRH